MKRSITPPKEEAVIRPFYWRLTGKIPIATELKDESERGMRKGTI